MDAAAVTDVEHVRWWAVSGVSGEDWGAVFVPAAAATAGCGGGGTLPPPPRLPMRLMCAARGDDGARHHARPVGVTPATTASAADELARTATAMLLHARLTARGWRPLGEDAWWRPLRDAVPHAAAAAAHPLPVAEDLLAVVRPEVAAGRVAFRATVWRQLPLATLPWRPHARGTAPAGDGEVATALLHPCGTPVLVWWGDAAAGMACVSPNTTQLRSLVCDPMDDALLSREDYRAVMALLRPPHLLGARHEVDVRTISTLLPKWTVPLTALSGGWSAQPHATRMWSAHVVAAVAAELQAAPGWARSAISEAAPSAAPGRVVTDGAADVPPTPTTPAVAAVTPGNTRLTLASAFLPGRLEGGAPASRPAPFRGLAPRRMPAAAPSAIAVRAVGAPEAPTVHAPAAEGRDTPFMRWLRGRRGVRAYVDGVAGELHSAGRDSSLPDSLTDDDWLRIGCDKLPHAPAAPYRVPDVTVRLDDAADAARDRAAAAAAALAAGRFDTDEDMAALATCNPALGRTIAAMCAPQRAEGKRGKEREGAAAAKKAVPGDGEDDAEAGGGGGPAGTGTKAGRGRGAAGSKAAKAAAAAAGAGVAVDPAVAAELAEEARMAARVAACGGAAGTIAVFDLKTLKAYLRSVGEKVSGNKPQLVERVAAHMARAAGNIAAAAAPPPAPGIMPPPPPKPSAGAAHRAPAPPALRPPPVLTMAGGVTLVTSALARAPMPVMKLSSPSAPHERKGEADIGGVSPATSARPTPALPAAPACTGTAAPPAGPVKRAIYLSDSDDD